MSVGTWTRIKEGHVIEVDSKSPVYLKAVDIVECRDFERHLQLQSEKVPHFRHDLPKERAYVKSKILKKNHDKGKRKSALSASPEPETSRKQKQKHMRASPPLLDIIDLASSNSNETKPILRPLHSKPSSIISISSDSNSSSSSGRIIWPRDFYTTDIVTCFLACEDSSVTNVEDVFQTFFTAPFAGLRSMRTGNAGGRLLNLSRMRPSQLVITKAGLWSKFVESIPTRRAEVKSARKQCIRTLNTSSQEGENST
jgi:hypothetical protein